MTNDTIGIIVSAAAIVVTILAVAAWVLLFRTWLDERTRRQDFGSVQPPRHYDVENVSPPTIGELDELSRLVEPMLSMRKAFKAKTKH